MKYQKYYHDIQHCIEILIDAFRLFLVATIILLFFLVLRVTQ